MSPAAFDKLKSMPVPKRNWRYDEWQEKNASQKENLGTPGQNRTIKVGLGRICNAICDQSFY